MEPNEEHPQAKRNRETQEAQLSEIKNGLKDFQRLVEITEIHRKDGRDPFKDLDHEMLGRRLLELVNGFLLLDKQLAEERKAHAATRAAVDANAALMPVPEMMELWRMAKELPKTAGLGVSKALMANVAELGKAHYKWMQEVGALRSERATLRHRITLRGRHLNDLQAKLHQWNEALVDAAKESGWSFGGGDQPGVFPSHLTNLVRFLASKKDPDCR